MARILQIRRGTTAQNNNFTGLNGEITVDTDQHTLRVHDGVTLGGVALARVDQIIPGGAVIMEPFDINSVPDEFWAQKIAQFAAGGYQVLTSPDVPVRTTTYIEYIFNNTDITPFFVRASMVCVNADAGYSTGDEVYAFGFGSYVFGAPNVYHDASGIHVRVNIASQTPWVYHRVNASPTNITSGAWKLRFRLYY